MARTLAQQLDCPLLGVSSYALMAPRLERQLPQAMQREPFWITQELPRRGWSVVSIGSCRAASRTQPADLAASGGITPACC